SHCERDALPIELPPLVRNKYACVRASWRLFLKKGLQLLLAKCAIKGAAENPAPVRLWRGIITCISRCRNTLGLSDSSTINAVPGSKRRVILRPIPAVET